MAVSGKMERLLLAGKASQEFLRPRLQLFSNASLEMLLSSNLTLSRDTLLLYVLEPVFLSVRSFSDDFQEHGKTPKALLPLLNVASNISTPKVITFTSTVEWVRI